MPDRRVDEAPLSTKKAHCVTMALVLKEVAQISQHLEFLIRLPEMAGEVSLKGSNGVFQALEDVYYSLSRMNIDGGFQREVDRERKEVKKWLDQRTEAAKPQSLQHLSENAREWRGRLYSTFESRIVVEASREIGLSAEKLSGGATIFVGDAWWRLSNIAQHDLNAAALCLLVGAWTPAVMISFRATEEALRRYYASKTGEAAVDMSWKQIVDVLLKRDDVRKTFAQYLDYIREARNAAEHPDRIFDAREAQEVFIQSCGVVAKVYSELPKQDKATQGHA